MRTLLLFVGVTIVCTGKLSMRSFEEFRVSTWTSTDSRGPSIAHPKRPYRKASRVPSMLASRMLRSPSLRLRRFRCFSVSSPDFSTEPKPPRKQTDASRLLSLARPQSKLLGGAFATLSLTSSVTLMFPFLTGQIIDTALTAPSTVDPQVAAVSLFSMICAAGAGVVARQILLTKAGESIVADLRGDLFKSILKQENR